MKCPICECDLQITKNEKKCKKCGFEDFRTEFINDEERVFWETYVVKPCKYAYRLSKTLQAEVLELKREIRKLNETQLNIVNDSVCDGSGNNSIKAKKTPEIIDYSQVTSDDAIIKGKTIQISGTEAKVYPGIIIPPGTYLVQETGGVTAKFYDADNKFTYIMNELLKPSHEAIFQTPIYMKFGTPGTLEVNSKSNWTLVLKPIG